MIRLVCIILTLLWPLLANAESCRQITNTINNDLTKYSGHIKDQHLPWMNLVWLQQQLGAANSKSVVENTTQYHWRCDVEGSYLVAVVDKNGLLLKLKGQYSSDEGSGMFATNIPKSEASFDAIKPKMTLPAPKLTPLTPVANNDDRVNRYNEHYHTHFQTSAEVEKDILQKIKHYYSSLRQCQSGTYEFPTPVLKDFLYNIAVISLQKDGLCPVKISYDIPQIGKIDLKCRHPQPSLQLYTDTEAEAVAHGASKFDNEHPNALQTVTEKECKRYIDGVL